MLSMAYYLNGIYYNEMQKKNYIVNIMLKNIAKISARINESAFFVTSLISTISDFFVSFVKTLKLNK